jgi:hypothetical protein
MRFHVMRNDEGHPVDFFVTVTSPVPRADYRGPSGCRCGGLYPVVAKSLQKDHVKQGARHDGRKFVCECHGELVHG